MNQTNIDAVDLIGHTMQGARFYVLQLCFLNYKTGEETEGLFTLSQN